LTTSCMPAPKRLRLRGYESDLRPWRNLIESGSRFIQSDDQPGLEIERTARKPKQHVATVICN
jgi:hypothetical protein